MTIDWNIVNSVLLLLLTIIAAMARTELHDIKKRVERMENAFITLGTHKLIENGQRSASM